MRTFDLNVPSDHYHECTCTDHGTDACTCRMLVLLVYQTGRQPASLVLHGHCDETFVYLADNPQQPVDRRLEAAIWQSILPLPGV